jgi:protein-tyrosine phosphatase
MFKNFTFSVFSLLLFSHCTQEKSDIRVVCESVPPGNYMIKWETFPPMEGTVKIYESSVPDSFNLYSPIAETNISKGFKDVFFAQSTKRSYFKLVFNKRYSVITAERIIPMQGLYNFRDLGGYYTEHGRQTRWGKMYRSSSLERTTPQDAKILNNLGIRTVIDFRTDRERNESPSKYIIPHTINFPLRGNPNGAFFDRILSKKMRVGDVKVDAQRLFSFLLENNSDYFSEMFDILLDPNNYPVLIHCSSGTDRSAVASALILSALGIDLDQIINDYMLSNKQIEFTSIPKDNPFLQDPEVQETFTALFRVHKETITSSFALLLKEYGTMDNYFSTALKLTAKKREKLKEIMLY